MLNTYPKEYEEKLGDFEKGVLKCYDNLLKKDLDNYFENFKDDNIDENSIIDRLKLEAVEEFLEYLENCIYSDRMEAQVCFIDNADESLFEDLNDETE